MATSSAMYDTFCCDRGIVVEVFAFNYVNRIRIPVANEFSILIGPQLSRD